MNYLKPIIIVLLLFIFLIYSAALALEQSDSSIFTSGAGQKRIELDMLNMDIESVLKIISDTSGWTIIPSQKIRGKVSLWSKGATARQLLDKLCLVNDYVYQQEGNVIFLMTSDEYKGFFGQTSKTFSLKHQKVENIKPLLVNSLTKKGKLSIDSWSNTIVVSDTVQNLKKIELLVARLDQGFVQKRFQLVNSRAANVVQVLDKVCPKEGPFQADVRTNSIIVFSSQSNVSRIAQLIDQLDQDAVTRVFQIRFQRASELASQLSSMLTGSDDSKKGASRTKQIIVSEETNQIVITGSASTVDFIAGIIEELDSRVITMSIPLKRLKASQILPQISHLAGKPENIKVDSQGNRLIIRDNTNNVEQISKVVQQLDEVLVTKVITLEYAMAEDIENVLRTLVTNPDTFRAETRTNQIIICDGSSQVDRIEDIIKKLDCEDAYFTRTYNLINASASHVAGIIEAFISKQNSQIQYSGISPATQREKSYETIVSTSPPFQTPSSNSELQRTGVALGSAPGLGGIQAAKKSDVPASEQSQDKAASGTALEPETASESIGSAGTVVADDRSNTITITETLVTLTKIEQLIHELDIPVHTYNYTVKYRRLDSMELDSKMSSLLRPEQDSFMMDQQTHTLYFVTLPSIAQRILTMLKEWDVPAKQALIRAKILAVNTSTLEDIGINLEALFEISNIDIGFESSLPSQVGADHFGSLTVRKLTGTEYQAVIRAIETDSHSQILASPRILALDGQSAGVRMATDEPFTETSIDADNGAVIENVRFLQVGTILQVTPTIREDDTIEMEIGLDVSSLTEIRNGIPVVNHNIANSTVAVKNNHILMIGGLKFKRTINGKEKIPVIGDIPLIGGLFGSQRSELADSELILLLQPTIVRASDNIQETDMNRAWEILKNEPREETEDGCVKG